MRGELPSGGVHWPVRLSSWRSSRTRVAADDAVESLKAWDKADDDIKLNAIGVLVLDDKGKIKTHKLGKRSVGKGAGIGLVLAVIAPPTLLAGVIGGGLLGAFHHKGLGLKAADRDRIAAQLSGGKAAVGVLVAPDMAIAISAKLTELGGTAEVHEVTEEAVAEVETAVPAVEAAEVAAGDDLSILDGVGPKYADALRAAGVTTFAQLSEMTPEAIDDVLAKANAPLIAGHNASTWPRQAKLAAARDWSASAALHRLDQEVALDGATSRDGPRNALDAPRAADGGASLFQAREAVGSQATAALVGEAFGTVLFRDVDPVGQDDPCV